jgi:Type II CAAX prenyl endopeptidase Rce1-like
MRMMYVRSVAMEAATRHNGSRLLQVDYSGTMTKATKTRILLALLYSTSTLSPLLAAALPLACCAFTPFQPVKVVTPSTRRTANLQLFSTSTGSSLATTRTTRRRERDLRMMLNLGRSNERTTGGVSVCTTTTQHLRSTTTNSTRPPTASASSTTSLDSQANKHGDFLLQVFDGETTTSTTTSNTIAQAVQNQVLLRWQNFRYGTLYVHDHFLDISYKIFSRVLLVDVALIAVLGLAHLISPALCSQIVGILERFLKMLTIPTNIHNAVCSALFASPLLVPFYALALSSYFVYGFVAIRIPVELAKRLVASGRPLAAKKVLWLRQNVLAVPLTYFKLFLQNTFPKLEAYTDGTPQILLASLLLNPMWIVAFVPLLEEVHYRSFFDRLQRWLANLNRASGSKSQSVDATTTLYGTTTRQATKLWFGRYRTWALVSSLFFATAHISNWYRSEASGWTALDTALDTLNPTTRLIAATSQFTLALIMGLDILVPLYDRAGFIGAFAGHMTWNAFNLLLFIPNYAVRLLLRERLQRTANKRT